MTMRNYRSPRPRSRRRRHLKPVPTPSLRRRAVYSYAVLTAEQRGAEVQR
jgi:hypothetical protein